MRIFENGVIIAGKLYGAEKEKPASTLQQETPPATDYYEHYEPSEYSYAASDYNCPPGG